MAVTDGNAMFVGRKWTNALLGIGLLGWAGVFVGLTVAREATHFAYLTAFTFVTSIALGALVLLMTTYVVGARWNAVIRRLNECVVSVLPVLAVCFLPIAFGLSDLYEWTASSAAFPEHQRHALEHKRAYLNAPFFIGRAALYFVLWSVTGTLLCRWSVRRDGAKPDPAAAASHAPHARERALSAALLPPVAIALTFASFDWLMSLQPLWVSSIFGVYYFSGGFVASLGLLAILAQAAAPSHGQLIRSHHFHALGRLMFGFTVFWAYIAFFQAMLINLANRPEEASFYVRRLDGGWKTVAWALFFVRFVLPFFVLLPRAIKFHGRAVALVGALIVAGNYLDMYWLVLPVHGVHGPLPNIWDLAALCALVGTSGVAAAAWLRGKAIVPIGDPLLEQSAAYRSPL